MSCTATRAQTRATAAKTPSERVTPSNDKQARQNKFKGKRKALPPVEEGSASQRPILMPGEFGNLETTRSLTEHSVQEVTSQLVEGTLSPLTEQATLPQAESTPAPGETRDELPSLLREPDLIPALQVPPENRNNLTRSPSGEDAPLDPTQIAQAMDQFMAEQSLRWTRYDSGPEDFDNHGVNPGRHQANKIEHMRNARIDQSRLSVRVRRTNQTRGNAHWYRIQ